MSNEYAPIVIFAFNRPDKLKRLVESLTANPEYSLSDIYVYIDGPREGKDAEAETVARSVEIANAIHGCKSVTVKASQQNKGLANSIIAGVTEVMNLYGRAIVLEDDLVVTPNFLTFMNQMLDRYEHNKKVFQISAFGLKVKAPRKYQYDVYYHYRAYSWGWASWRDRWESVDWSVDYYYEMSRDSKKRHAFNRGGSDLYHMLDSFVHGRNNSWYIRFDYAMHKQDCLCVIPLRSLVRNDGFGDSATHCKGFNRYKIHSSDGDQQEFASAEVIEPTPAISRQVNFRYSIPFRAYCKIVNKSLNLIKKIKK